MTDETLRQLLEISRSINKQLESISLSGSNYRDLLQAAEEASRYGEAFRTMALGPLKDLSRSDSFHSGSKLMEELKWIPDAVAEIEKQFRLPEITEAMTLFGKSQDSDLAEVLKRYSMRTTELQHALEKVNASWLDITDAARSLRGFAELQGIGNALSTMPAFSTRFSEMLRIDLGDWRGKISWPTDVFTDIVARTVFYADRGLDPAMTAFPSKAFEEGITTAGLKVSPPLVQSYDSPRTQEEDDEEAGFERTNAAHDRLQRFETQLRRFIDEQMRAAFGENWAKHQVPGDIRQSWLEKRRRAREYGEADWPLIAYADFTDYVPIITRKDNWDTVFKPTFQRKTLVQEAFQRLYPVRICTMHGRLITQDDELFLYVETKRILGAIGISI